VSAVQAGDEARDVIGAFERAAYELSVDASLRDVEVVTTSHHKHRGSIEFRVVIDKPGGVDVATCERIAHKLNAALDHYPQMYTLSVESAGLERPLLRPADYQRFIGSNVKLTTDIMVRGAKTHRGRLEGLRGTNVILTQKDGELPLPLTLIKHANLEYDPRADLAKEKKERRHR
jgi:ribosome maturation factor RimP